MDCVAPPLIRTGRVKRLVLMLVGIALCLTPPLPAPSSASTEEVVVNATVFLNPLEVNASAPARVRRGTVFTVQAIIRNRGNLGMRKATAVIHLPMNLDLVRSKAEVKLGSVRAHKDAVATWRVKVLRNGNYVILVSASATYGAIAVANEDSILVSVTR